MISAVIGVFGVFDLKISNKKNFNKIYKYYAQKILLLQSTAWTVSVEYERNSYDRQMSVYRKKKNNDNFSNYACCQSTTIISEFYSTIFSIIVYEISEN